MRWCGNEGGFTRQSEWNVIGPYAANPNSAYVFCDHYGDLDTRDILFSNDRPYYPHYHHPLHHRRQ